MIFLIITFILIALFIYCCCKVSSMYDPYEDNTYYDNFSNKYETKEDNEK